MLNPAVPITKYAVHRASEADARDLQVYFQTLTDEPLNNTSVRRGLIPQDHVEMLALIRKYATRENSLMCIARANRQIVGIVQCEGHKSAYQPHVTELHINVHPDYRGAGIGSGLMRYALEWAHTQPTLKRIELEVLARNDGAIRLYSRMGFSIEGYRHDAYYLVDEGGIYVDALVMAYYL
ncbi:MAG: GNAT family N-acetyltransferase [Anaerolineae bacterium]|nr:GNAT family N-acetyltransferase [Anaerolineae bacterium]